MSEQAIRRAQTALKAAIQAVDAALPGAGPVTSGPTSRAQLEKFRSTLDRMLADVEARAMGAPCEVVPPLGRIIADSWPFDSALGEAILAAEEAYERVAGAVGGKGAR